MSAIQLQRLGGGVLQQISAIRLPFVRLHYSICALTPVIHPSPALYHARVVLLIVGPFCGRLLSGVTSAKLRPGSAGTGSGGDEPDAL